jgi:PAS domain S-box-containing protein
MFELNKDGIHLTYHGDRNKFFVPPEKFIGKSVSDVLPENVAKKYLQMIHRTIELKESQNFEYNLLINNKLHYYNASMVTMGEENVLVLVRDITEHKMIDILLREREQFELSRNLKNEEQKFQFIVQNAPNIIITTNLVGEISFINQDFLNFPYYSLIGKSIIDLINPIETFRIERYIKNVIERGSPISYDIESENDSGKVWFHINLGLLMEDNIPKSLIFIITDITNEKKTEDQLRIQTAEIQEKNKELQEFAHIVSHDLKTPLKTISSMVHLIQSDDINLDIVLVKDHLKRIDERVNMMEDLIDGILQYSNIGLIEDSQEDVNLHELLKEVIKSLNPDKPFNINVSQDLPFMKINKFRVYQIFQNLLSNAIKYNDKDEIKISIVGNIFDSSYYQIKVSDNGKGIKSEHFDLIFQIFKTPNEIRKPNSTGVGLAIVKKIINFLEGVIWVESKIGFGSSFIFLIPLKYFSTNQRK